MNDYIVLTMLDEEDDDQAAVILKKLLSIMKCDKASIVYVGSLERAKRIALREHIALPFSAFVDSFEEFEEAREEEERQIFYAVDYKEKMSHCLKILRNTTCQIFLTLGSHRDQYSMLVEEALPNVLSCLILAEGGYKIFPFPKSVKITKETLMDQIINIDSICQSPYFDQSKPYVLVKEEREDIDYEWIKRSSEKIGMEINVKNYGEKIDSKEAKALISISALNHQDDLKTYFGLPFYYFNAVRQAEKAIDATLYMDKLIQRRSL